MAGVNILTYQHQHKGHILPNDSPACENGRPICWSFRHLVQYQFLTSLELYDPTDMLKLVSMVLLIPSAPTSNSDSGSLPLLSAVNLLLIGSVSDFANGDWCMGISSSRRFQKDLL